MKNWFLDGVNGCKIYQSMTSFNISTPQTGSSSGASCEVNKALQYKENKLARNRKKKPYKTAIGCLQWFDMIAPLIKLLNKRNHKT